MTNASKIQNPLFTIVKYELLRYFISPLAYVYLIAFLILNSSFAIYFGNFFERGQADLSPMFSFHPWLYLIFIPGISMRLWSEEFRSKTIVQIMTMPVSLNSLVWGKFFASWAFCAIALLLTFPFWITVNILGSPDNGIIILSYLGSLILAGCMLAISQTMSALTKNQVIALVLAVVANMLFFLSGLEYVLSFFRLFAPLSIIDMIASFSFISHFNIITQGLLELRDVVFFASIIALFNFTTSFVVSFKTSGTSNFLKSNTKSHYIIAFLMLLISFIGLNLIANNTLRSIQLDVTKDKMFTLSSSTKKLLQKLPDPINAKLYYSRELEQKNPQIRLMFDKIRLLLREFSKISDGKFSYTIYYPKPLDKAEDIAYAEGLQPIPLIEQNQNVFFGMSLSDNIDNKQLIPFFPLERQQYIEQDIVEKIYALSHKKKTVGIITSLPIFETAMSESYISQQWEIITQIEKFYKIIEIRKPEDIYKSDVLMLIHPRKLPSEIIKAIGNYTLAGGNSLVLLDVASEAPRIFSPVNLDFVPSDIGELENLWGFAWKKDYIIGDLENSITVDATKDYKKNPIFVQDIVQFVSKSPNFNPNAIETQNLKNILFASATSIIPASDKVIFVPLIEASAKSELMNRDLVYKQMHPSYILSLFKPDSEPKVIAAKIINKDPSRPFKVIVAADTDFIYESFWAQSQSILETNYFIPVFDNANFILNSLESLSGGENLIDLRGKSQTPRPFDMVEKIRKTSQQEFKIKENIIFQKIEDTKAALQEIWGKKSFEGRENFTPDELAIIAKARQNLEALRKELAQTKEAQDTDIKRIDTLVKLFNIYLIPSLIVLTLLTLALLRTKKRTLASLKFSSSREVNILTAIAAALLLLGIASTYLGAINDTDSFKDKPVFTNLSDNINKVDKISIQSSSGSLNFIKTNGIWELEGFNHLPVYQERIRSFLSAMLEATYFDKKSAKAEHLSIFGLQPIEVDNSPNIRISLQNANGQSIEKFEVGKYDLDIGRGAKSAYIKFDNQFQVWQIAVDFIDLSTNWQDWTYSTAWNLRFGRFLKINDITNTDKLADIAKVLLNTEFKSVAELNRSSHLFDLDITTEDNYKVKLNMVEDNKKYFISYIIPTTAENSSLEFFAKDSLGAFYEIDQSAMEKIRNVINN